MTERVGVQELDKVMNLIKRIESGFLNFFNLLLSLNLIKRIERKQPDNIHKLDVFGIS